VQEVDSEERRETLFDQLRDDDYVRIHRMDDFDKRWVYHGRLAMHEANEEYVGRAIGGGYYRVQLMSKFNTDGRQYKIEGTRTFKLPGKYTPPATILGDTQTGASTDAQQPAQRPEVGTIDGMSPGAALNTALVATVVDLLKSFKDQPKQAPPQPINWQELISGAVQLATLFKREKPDLSPLDMLRAVKELMPAPVAGSAVPGGAANTVADMVKGMKELIGLKDMVEGKESADPESLMWGAAGKALDMLPQLMGKGNGNKSPVSAPEEARPALSPGTPKWKMLLLLQKKRLLDAASYGLDPATAAETALTFLPQPMHGVLAEFLQMPDHVNVCMQTIPELAEFQQWTTNFFAELEQQFMGEEEDDAEEGSEREVKPS
jgi:hypothetical protein